MQYSIVSSMLLLVVLLHQMQVFSGCFLWFEGYLHYKLITSQNVPSEAFHRKLMFHSRDISVFVFLTIS